MRQIKFRAWDKEQKKWLDNVCLLSSGVPQVIRGSVEFNKLVNSYHKKHNTDIGGSYAEIDYSDWYGANHVSVQQFTGLLDKNGKEIWEGDIVNAAFMHRGEPGTPFRAFILYNEHIGSFRIGYDSLGGGSQDEIYFRYQIEVVGNAFENPELITTRVKELQDGFSHSRI